RLDWWVATVTTRGAAWGSPLATDADKIGTAIIEPPQRDSVRSAPTERPLHSRSRPAPPTASTARRSVPGSVSPSLADPIEMTRSIQVAGDSRSALCPVTYLTQPLEVTRDPRGIATCVLQNGSGEVTPAQVPGGGRDGRKTSIGEAVGSGWRVSCPQSALCGSDHREIGGNQHHEESDRDRQCSSFDHLCLHPGTCAGAPSPLPFCRTRGTHAAIPRERITASRGWVKCL